MLDKPPIRRFGQDRSGAAGAFRRHRRREIRHHRSGPQGAVSRRNAQSVPGPHADGVAAVVGRRGVGNSQARQRDGDADRAAGRQYRPGRRPDSAPQRDRALAQPARSHPRSRSGLEHHHLRGRRHLAARAGGRRRRRPALSATAAVGRHAAPSAAILPPMPAAPRRWLTASRARTRSASKSCWPTAACSTISTS